MNRGTHRLRIPGWLAIPLPLPAAALTLLALVYCVLGLIGHAPWKTEDAIGIGIMHGMFAAGSADAWLFPRLAGELYLEDGPLFYALAAACAKLLSFVLEPHEGARIASAICIAATLWFARAAGREFFGRETDPSSGSRIEGDGAALILIGTLGLFVHAHEVLAENGSLAGIAMAWFGLARFRASVLRGGLWFGAGIAIAFWSKGPVPLAPILVAVLVAPAMGSDWRTRDYLRFIATGLVILLASTIAWYAVLRTHGAAFPELWREKQLAVFSAPSWARALNQLQLLSWATWPAWPLAFWALRERRHRLRNNPILLLCAAVIASLATFAFTRTVNEVHVMPLMLTLALAAGAGVPALRRGAANALAWFGGMTFTVAAGLVWLGWFAMMSGFPGRIALNFSKLEPGYVPQFDFLAFTIALALTACWIVLLWRSERSLHRSTAFWAGGVTLAWGLAMTLWLPWIDYGKTYQPVARSLAAAVKKTAPAARCIDSRGLGEAQRAAFDYHANIVTRRLEIHARSACPLLLVQASTRDSSAADRLDPGWRRVWEGNRPRDRERYRLYVRE